MPAVASPRVVPGGAHVESFEVFTPNCPTCLLPMKIVEREWRCRECSW